MIIPVKTASGGYDIILQRGALKCADQYLNLNRRVLIVTDNGVPAEYARSVASLCAAPLVLTIWQGEQSKSIDSWTLILKKLSENGFTRSDCVVAVGGGVVGDLAGFAASVYMRGIDFYNIPTTVLSQVDSSIGGKTAVDFMGYKNIVGAFYPPKAVIIDPDTLSTLPDRQISNGLCEALKMSLTHDAELFKIFESGNAKKEIDTVIERSLYIKRSVVEADEREGGLRMVLNFGHTLAHAIESANGMEELYHGECVAIGMLPMCSKEIRERLVPVLKNLGLPTEVQGSREKLFEAMRHDKKLSGKDITIVFVPEVGSFRFEKLPLDTLIERMKDI